MKISREGIVLIKSFEGFRPRAIRRENGGWVIGYGHTLSAREGATVSEADAELLLRYDLLPVEKSVNATVPAPLNQHQFDALVSFAFSLGLERFAGSDVLARLTSGAPEAAAEAMMGWPEPLLRESALRRRAAERALFFADPTGPVALSDLLSAPLVVSDEAPHPLTEPARPEPLSDPEAVALPEERQPEVHEPASGQTVAEPDARSAAVAALLGEADGPEATADEPATGIPVFADAVMPETTATAGSDQSEPEPDASADADVTGTPVAESPDLLPGQDAAVPATDATGQDADTPPPEAPTPRAPAADPVALAVARYAPYSASMVGPLPYLLPAAPRIERVEPTPAVDDIAGNEPAAADSAVAVPATADATDSPLPSPQAPEPAAEAAPEPEPAPEAQPEPEAAVVPQPEIRTISFASHQAGRSPEEATEPPAAGPLVLTPLLDGSDPAPVRPLWMPEQRPDPELTGQTGLFGEDLNLTHGGGALLRHEVELTAPARFDWSETGAFIIMGAVGLTAFGASMAAFRLASEQNNGGAETAMIAWVLAIIGAACVGVSSFNLYRRWGLPGGD